MFYKQKEDGSWIEAKEVHFPDGEVISENNKGPRNGFSWSGTRPPNFSKIPSHILDKWDDELIASGLNNSDGLPLWKKIWTWFFD